MPIEVNDIIRASAKILLHTGDFAYNVWWARANGTGSANEDDVATAFKTFLERIYTEFSANMHIGALFSEAVVDHVAWEDTPTPPGWKIQQTLGIPLLVPANSPASAADPLPNSDAVLLRMIPAIRKHQGRKYFPAWTEGSNTTEGKVGPVLVGDVLAAGVESMTDEPIPNSSLNLGMVVPNMSGPATLYYNSVITGNVWRDQRRRQEGVGL